MKRSLLIAGFTLGVFVVSYSQTVQWASEVIEFSSELTPVQYSARQILGKPNVLPAGGQNPNAWTPDKPKRKEFVKVGYANPIQIQQVAIAESYNPSAISQIFLYDEANTEYLIHNLNPTSVPIQGRMLNVFMEKTAYKVKAVKLEFDGAALPDYYSIDAVAISDSNYPIIADISIPELLSKGLIVEKLDENVNSDYSELNPLLSPDGKTLYFSRKNHPENVGGVNDKEDIWFSELGADGKWSIARNMGSEFNNASPNFVNAVSAATPDGKSVVLLLGNKYLEDGKMTAGVSVSDNVNGTWTTPRPLNIQNDYNFNEKANYFMANTRKALLMSVEREDSQGGRDLYVSFIQNDTLWSQPLNLGEVINTAGEETAPFLSPDNATLYFSSDGFSGFGKSDVYMSKRLDDTWTNWTEPENMGPDINTKLDDLFFNIPSTSEYAYYSREESPDNTDVYRVKLPVFLSPEPFVIVKGKLVDAKTGEPISAKIIYEQLPEGKEIGVAQSNPETGEYEIQLPGGHLYGVRAEAEGHISENQNLDLRKVTKDGVVQTMDIRLDPIQVALIEPDATIQLNNIFFAFDQSTLLPESFPELNRIVELMGDRPSLEVEIAGHADATGTEEYNMGLSERRANSVARYLKDKGVVADRMTITFFGETKPIETNATLEGRRKNRRVEFKILKM
jgi:outer membrane protein OmpA-like peptidoglycan-associated protein